MGDWLHTKTVYLPKKVTHSSTNRVQPAYSDYIDHNANWSYVVDSNQV